MTREERKITIDYLEGMKEEYIEGEGYERYPLPEWFALDKAIELLEQTKWIPVSERLPEENGWYQCTVAINDLPRTMKLFYKNGKWLDTQRIDMFNTYDIYGYGNTKEKHKLSYQELISEFEWTENVIAWQPLTESYKSYRESEEE